MDYGRALARLRGRRDDAMRALRTAEANFPTRVHRNPFAREVLDGCWCGRGRMRCWELRGMASRAGLPA